MLKSTVEHENRSKSILTFCSNGRPFKSLNLWLISFMLNGAAFSPSTMYATSAMVKYTDSAS